MDNNQIFTIIGGGVVGVSLSIALRKKFPHNEVYLLEKEKFLFDHSSSRNSGVLHSGLYYPTGSLKHRLCMEGIKLWKEFCVEHGVTLIESGKYIVSNSDEGNIKNLFKQSQQNNLNDVRWIDTQELGELKKRVVAEKAFFIPATSSINVSEAIKKMEVISVNSGCEILTDCAVNGISITESGKFVIKSTKGEIESDYLFNCAGHGAVSLRKQLGLLELEDYFVKGVYLRTQKDHPSLPLIYPSNANKKTLGLHNVESFSGKLKFGPTAKEVDYLDYDISENEVLEASKGIRNLFKCLEQEKFYADTAGVRSKIKLGGQLHYDFWIKAPGDHGKLGYYECAGIDSPGLTSCFAIANYIMDLLNDEA